MTDHTHDLERVFSHRAFIPFVTCGDPDIETTEGLVRAMAEAGADLIELGIPFSDPIAEGPVIQGADVRAPPTTSSIWRSACARTSTSRCW